jgi:hypothetical protein
MSEIAIREQVNEMRNDINKDKIVLENPIQ